MCGNIIVDKASNSIIIIIKLPYPNEDGKCTHLNRSRSYDFVTLPKKLEITYLLCNVYPIPKF